MTFRIAFLVDSVPFSAGEISGAKSLGGSESACIGVARALVGHGHGVDIFATKLDPSCHGPDAWGVRWHNAEQFSAVSEVIDWDVVCGLRMPNLFMGGPIRAKLRVLWNQDLMNADQFKNAVMAGAWAYDKLVYVSEFHRQQWEEWIPEVVGPSYVTKNGFDPSFLPTNPKPKDPNRIIHISRPERGLAPLLAMWPAFKAANPKAELQICRYNSMYDADGWGAVCKSYDREAESINARVGGITFLGELGKAELYQAISEAAVMWYPGIADFAETSCLAAVEAQACGTPFVGSFKGALPETIPSGVFIAGDAFSPDYMRVSMDAVAQMLDGCARNTVDYRRRVMAGREHAQHYTFAAIGAEWDQWLHETFDSRYEQNKLGVLRQLLQEDDHVAAKMVAHDIQAQSGLSADQYAEAVIAEALCDRVAAGTEHTADDYANGALGTIAEIKTKNVRLEKIVDQLAGCTHVLDVACGNGAHALALCLQYPDIQVTAIDFSPRNIEAATAAAAELGIDRVTWVCAPVWDFAELRMSDDWLAFAARGRRFDGLLCGEFVEHVTDARALVDALETVVKPGGTILYTCPSGPLGELMTRTQHYHRSHVHSFHAEDVQAVWGQKQRLQVEIIRWPGLTPMGNICGNWVIQYQASDAPTGKRPYAQRIVTTRPRPKLSVGILTYNSDKDLLRCLDAVWAIADEILIGDGGSTDTTLAIAKSVAKVRVIPIDPIQEQPDGFAGARNILVKEASGDWFLWVDTDEVLVGTYGLRHYLDGPIYNGFAIPQNHLQLDAPQHADKPVRIFRLNANIQFYGCVHEQPQMGDCNGDVVPALQISDAQIAHTGYLVEGIRKEKMLKRNFPLVLRDQQRFPDRVLGKLIFLRDLVNLADVAAEQAGYQWPPESRDYFRRALAYFHRHFWDPSHHLHNLARPWYERALQALELGTEVEQSLGARAGGLNGSHPTPRRFWVRGPDELELILAHQAKELTKKMRVTPVRFDPIVGEPIAQDAPVAQEAEAVSA